MKLINALIVSSLGLSLAACSVSISDSGVHEADVYEGRDDFVTVTLPSGDRDSFNCPDETEVFVVDARDEGRGMIYGCRTASAKIPALEE
jgi:hypothetical protein